MSTILLRPLSLSPSTGGLLFGPYERAEKMKIQDIFIPSDRLFSFQELKKDYFLCVRKVKSHGCCTQKDREEIAQTLVLNVLTDILPYLGSAQYTAHNSNSTKTNFMIQFRNQLNIKRHSSMC